MADSLRRISFNVRQNGKWWMPKGGAIVLIVYTSGSSFDVPTALHLQNGAGSLII